MASSLGSGCPPRAPTMSTPRADAIARCKSGALRYRSRSKSRHVFRSVCPWCVLVRSPSEPTRQPGDHLRSKLRPNIAWAEMVRSTAATAWTSSASRARSADEPSITVAGVEGTEPGPVDAHPARSAARAARPKTARTRRCSNRCWCWAGSCGEPLAVISHEVVPS